MSSVLILIALGVSCQTASESTRCGAHCLEVALHALGHPNAATSELHGVLGEPSSKGYALAQLQSAAEEVGLRTRLVKTSLDNLRRRKTGFVCLVPVDGNHYVLVADYDGTDVWIVDPPRDYTQAAELFESRWDGTALLIASTEIIPEDAVNSKWRIMWLILIVLVPMSGIMGWRVFQKRRRP